MSEFVFSVVENDDADVDPYPYVFVDDDGRYRELSTDEKAYLQEKFSPFDGARPYVKSRYWQMTPDSRLSGFLARKRLPRGLKEGERPEARKWWELWRPNLTRI
jgi:hypothetical protein